MCPWSMGLLNFNNNINKFKYCTIRVLEYNTRVLEYSSSYPRHMLPVRIESDPSKAMEGPVKVSSTVSYCTNRTRRCYGLPNSEGSNLDLLPKGMDRNDVFHPTWQLLCFFQWFLIVDSFLYNLYSSSRVVDERGFRREGIAYNIQYDSQGIRVPIHPRSWLAESRNSYLWAIPASRFYTGPRWPLYVLPTATLGNLLPGMSAMKRDAFSVCR
jgi:hypothetical protein